MADLREQVRVGIRINPQIGAGKFLRLPACTPLRDLSGHWLQRVHRHKDQQVRCRPRRPSVRNLLLNWNDVHES